MASRRFAITSGFRAFLLILLIIGVFLVSRSLIIGGGVTGPIYAAVHRIFDVARDDRSGMPWLIMVCIATGLLVISDRRRRARVRQASS